METELNSIQINNWGLGSSGNLLIAGPCSAESEQQMISTAQGLRHCSIDVFRAGIWKPRTRPGSFEGVGKIGLSWLKTIKKEYGYAVATEVANANHAYEALKFDVDVLWIGARTTVNPFAIQEIADALQGTDKIILVKNPVNPDLELWIGALERFLKAGVNKIGAIHRGFTYINSKKYRNIPNWRIPLELRKMLPNIPLICDPSHISGDRNLIQPVSKRALNLGFNGLMIEAHCNPISAKSDSNQQLKPAELSLILKNLNFYQDCRQSTAFKKELNILRNRIDSIDKEIIDIIYQRMQIVNEIGHGKAENEIPVLQDRRWNDVLDNCKEYAYKRGVSKDLIQKVFNAIHEESVKQQVRLII